MAYACCVGPPVSPREPWITLALGIGATAAIFSVIRTVMLEAAAVSPARIGS